MVEREPAVLALADGTVFCGSSIGASGTTTGEVVFNTAMTGYQEILTDPSYQEQIVTLTYPHIGNTGINSDDNESNRIHAAGLIVRNLSLIPSNYRSTQSLSDFLIENNIIAIADIDTRKLTNILREKGAQNGCIKTGVDAKAAALSAAKVYPGLNGIDLAKVVSCEQIYEWQENTAPQNKKHIVVYDFGVKHNILRSLANTGAKITVVPAQTAAKEILKLNPDGVLLSNGPGDPAACDYAIKNIQELLQQKMPLFGICLGFQLLALAVSAKTYKMKFGHHGANHPVKDLQTGKVFITSQNHSFSVDPKTLPSNTVITHESLFDGSLQGFELTDSPAFAFQGHPEAAPGPHDIHGLFEKFIRNCNA